MNRAIEHAYCLTNNERFSISKHTNSQVERFELRKSVQGKKRKFECIECGQNLTISVSINDIIYFRHLRNADDCVLKNASNDDIKSFNAYYAAKESPRHKELKNEIGKKLSKLIDVSDLHIDDKFLNINGEKRRPDVYCKYKKYELAFEIQLSDLSLNYLCSRHEFYRKNGIYLIWILDNFNPDKSSQLVRDIKYLNTYQNFFKLNGKDGELSFICKYKQSYITPFYKVHDRWTEELVTLDELCFNDVENEVYFKDYNTIKTNLELQAEKEKQEEEQSRELERLKTARKKAERIADNIIEKIREIKNKELADYSEPENEISSMYELEIKVLNEKLDLCSKPVVIDWFKKAKKRSHFYFLLFILRCKEIKIEVNQTFEGDTLFSALMRNNVLRSHSMMKELLKRGYKTSEIDKKVCVTNEDRADLLLSLTAEKFLSGSEIDILFEDKNRKLFFIIESMKQGEIINSGLSNWVAFGNNLIEYYNDYWEYLETALKHFGIWDKIINADSFKNKLEIRIFNLPLQKTDFRDVFDKLYPELR